MNAETITPADVISEATKWLRTPFHDDAKRLGVGVDCARFIEAVFQGIGIKLEDFPPYSPQWHLNRDQELFAEHVLKYCDEIPAEAVRPGDIVLWRFGRCYSHGAIYCGRGEVIHAMKADGFVRFSGIDEGLLAETKRRKRRYFRWKGFRNV